jgi:hypothetical protein
MIFCQFIPLMQCTGCMSAWSSYYQSPTAIAYLRHSSKVHMFWLRSAPQTYDEKRKKKCLSSQFIVQKKKNPLYVHSRWRRVGARRGGCIWAQTAQPQSNNEPQPPQKCVKEPQISQINQTQERNLAILEHIDDLNCNSTCLSKLSFYC